MYSPYANDNSTWTDGKGQYIAPTESLLTSVTTADTANDARWRAKPPPWSGWRFGAISFATGTAIVLILNVALSQAAIKQHGLDSNMIGTLFHGSCEESEKLDFWLHIAINALSTILLAGSNFCMQCLTSPTRGDVDRAHKRRRWVDIGIPSIRNLRHVGWMKSTIWVLLGASSVPLHLMYNSAVFETVAAVSYWNVDIPENHLTDFYAALGDGNSTYERLEKATCASTYATPFITSRGNVAIIQPATTNNSYIIPNITNLGENDFVTSGTNTGRTPFDWLYEDLGALGDNRNRAAALAKVDQWSALYCYSQKVEENCSLQFSAQIILVVIICNALKLFCMICTILTLNSHKPLVTVGDAIASFLETKDETTRDICLVSKADIKDIWGKKNRLAYQPVARLYQPKRRRWWRASSKKRWFLAYAIAVTCLGGVGILLAGQLSTLSGHIDTSLSGLWSLGFGAIDTNTLLSLNSNTMFSNAVLSIPVVAIISNIPQTILAISYLLYNSLLTSMLLAKEWDDYSTQRKALRVSCPTGYQRSNYFLQLPFRYSAPLLTSSFMLHFLFSRSLFLVRVTLIDTDGVYDEGFSINDCGYSPIAIVFSIALGFLMLITAALLGLWRFKSQIPLAGSCSAAISAACHRSDGDEKAAWKTVKWGETKFWGHRPAVCHVAFSSEEVFTPVVGTWYAKG